MAERGDSRRDRNLESEAAGGKTGRTLSVGDLNKGGRRFLIHSIPAEKGLSRGGKKGRLLGRTTILTPPLE